MSGKGWEKLAGRADFESGDYFAGHGGVEGVELLGPVQLDGADAVDVVEEDVVGVVAGLFSGYIGGGRTFSHLYSMSAPLLPSLYLDRMLSPSLLEWRKLGFVSSL